MPKTADGIKIPHVGMKGKVLRKDLYFEETGYSPHPAQQTIHYDIHRHRVLCNGRRWGKSLLGAKEAEPTCFILNRLQEPQRGWIVGPEYTDCEKEFRILYDSLKKLGVDAVSTKFLNNVENGNMHIKTRWGWDIECRSAKHPETLTGEGLDFVLMVEAGRHKRKTWTEYVRPALADKRGWSLHSGVPEGATETSLLYHLWQRGQDDNDLAWASWRMPSWTNPISFPGGRYDEEILDAEADLTEDEFRRQFGAEFVERFGRVMQEWDDEIHLANLKYNPEWPVYAAIDYGYTNPFVWLWIQTDPFNRAYVIRERRWQLKDTTEVCADMLKDPVDSALVRKCAAFYPDPAEPDDTNIIRTQLKITPRLNTGGERKTRDAIIRSKLKRKPDHGPEEMKQPGILVDRSQCKMLAWEMREGYRWPEHKSEIKNDSEEPLDKNNHGPEALGRFGIGFYSIVEPEKRHSRQRRAKIRR